MEEQKVEKTEETKGRTYRISDKNADRILKISNEYGESMESVFTRILSTWEQAEGRNILQKKESYDVFNQYINTLSSMYLQSLQNNEDMADLIRTEFEKNLESKDNVIQDLQEQLKKAKESAKTAAEKATNLEKENANLKDTIEQENADFTEKISSLQGNLEDKEQLNKALMESEKELKEKITEMKQCITEYQEIKEQCNTLQKDKAALEKELE